MKDNMKQDLGLMLTLSISTLVCVLCAFVDIAMLLFATAVPFFCLQLLLLRLTRKLPVRLIPLLPIALMLSLAGYYWFFGSGWDRLATLIFGLASIAPAVGCLAAVLVHRFGRKISCQKWVIVLLVVLGCAGAWFGQEYALDYWERAFIKILSFGSCVGVYYLVTPSASLRSAPPPQGGRSKSAPLAGELSPPQAVTEGGHFFQKPDHASLKLSLPLALAVFLFLTVGYMLLSPWMDLSAIPEQLRYSGITAQTFPIVAVYITLVNSLLEEIFFRGFAFLTLKRYTTPAFAYGFSGLSFALYHVSIMDGWFHPIWFGLFIAGLAVAGILFDFLDRRGSIWNGWLVHASANLAINLIGMRMFGIL